VHLPGLQGAKHPLKKGAPYATDSCRDCLGRRWDGPVGDQQLHTHAGHHKEDLECCRRHLRDYMAFECLRAHREHLRYSYWEVKGMTVLAEWAKDADNRVKTVLVGMGPTSLPKEKEKNK
jgi:hypothetical protein